MSVSVRLVPMSEASLKAFLQEAVPSYAKDHVDAGNWTAEEALEKARQQYDELLPEGVDTEGHHLYDILDGTSGAKVGIIWFMDTPREGVRLAYVCELSIDEGYRRQGYGTQAMRAVEQEVRALGIERIALHVFGHNHPARALYEKVGYEETNIHMAKNL